MNDDDFVAPNDDPSNATQSASYTGTAGNTGGFPAGVSNGVLVWCTTDAYVKVGENAVATSANTPIPANTPVIFRVPQGTNAAWRVSAIQISSGGTVYAKPVS